jgi:hypothetical protein
LKTRASQIRVRRVTGGEEIPVQLSWGKFNISFVDTRADITANLFDAFVGNNAIVPYLCGSFQFSGLRSESQRLVIC